MWISLLKFDPNDPWSKNLFLRPPNYHLDHHDLFPYQIALRVLLQMLTAETFNDRDLRLRKVVMQEGFSGLITYKMLLRWLFSLNFPNYFNILFFQIPPSPWIVTSQKILRTCHIRVEERNEQERKCCAEEKF